MKKIWMLMMLQLMILALFSGCETKQTPVTPEAPLEIRWVARAKIGGLTAKDNYVKHLLEERYDIKITVEQVNIHDRDQYNLYWATGGNPTVINMNNTAVSVFKLAEQGLVRSIPEGWLDRYMPNWMAANAVNMGGRDVVDSMIRYRGKDYIVPYSGQSHGYIMGIRKDWLENLGLQMPTDADSLIEVMKAFTFDDPDGNGVDDTYGMHGGGQKDYMRFGYLQTQFEIWPDCFWNVDGTIIYTDTTQAYRDSLRYLADLYSLGIVDPEFAVEDRVTQRTKWAAGKFGIIVDHPTWFNPNLDGNLTTMLLKNNPEAEIAFLPNWTTVNGNPPKIVSYYPHCGDDGASFFGSSATDEQVKKILQIYEDVYQDFEFWMLTYFGQEGVDWQRDARGVLKLLPPRLEGGDEYAGAMGYGSFVQVPQTKAWLEEHRIESDYVKKAFAFAEQYDTLWFYNNFIQPPSEAYNRCYPDIKALSDDFYYNAVMGTVDLDQEWDAYQERLREAGLLAILEDFQRKVNT